MRAVRDQKWCSYGRRLGCVFALTLFVFQSFMVHAADLLTITNISTHSVSGGMSDTEEFRALVNLIAEARNSQLALKPIITFGDVRELSERGLNANAVLALPLLEKENRNLGGRLHDDLIVTVSDQQIIPRNGESELMLPETSLQLNTKISFERGLRIQLIEYDSVSANDDLGYLEINNDWYDLDTPGADYEEIGAIVADISESSIYFISFKVTRNAGIEADVIENMICGTELCNVCFNEQCDGQTISNLDRDKDFNDLKSCPVPLLTTGFRKFPQIIVADVYLRVCGDPCPTMSRPTLSYTLPAAGRPIISWARSTSIGENEELKFVDEYQLIEINISTGISSLHSVFSNRFVPASRKQLPLPPGTYEYRVRPISTSTQGGGEQCNGTYSEKLMVIIPDIPVTVDIEEVSADDIGRGTGSVSFSQAPVSSVGGNYYTPGDVITLTAVPTERSEFVEWGGDSQCGNTLSCALTIVAGAGMNVRAIFRPKPSLSVFSVGGGSVGIVPEGVACTNAAYSCFQYSTGDVVTLTPFWSGDMEFDHFEGDPDCDDFTVTINSSLSCTAVFKRTSYNLTITPSDGSKVSSDSGTIDCGERCSASYPVNDSSLKLTELLTATINPGFTFVRWAGDNGCWDASTLVNVNDPLKRNVDVGGKDVNCSVIAVPEDTVYALTIEKLGGGTVKAEATPFVNSRAILICPAGNACTVDYPVNAQVTLTAKATRGSEFVGFESPDVGSDNYRREDDDCIDGQISMIESISCVATFKTNILVVNGADDDNSKEQNEYIAVLNNMDPVDYDIWHIKHPSSGDNTFDTTTNQRRVEPSAEDLANYGRVIWYTGNAGTEQAVASLKAGPSEAAEASLASYLDSGGCLLMSGPEYFKDRGLTPFMKNYLGVSGITEDVEASYIKGAGDGILGFNTLTQESFTGASSEGYFRFQGSFPPYSSDALIPNPDIPDGNILFTYQDDNFGNIRSRGDAAIAIDTGTYRAAFFGFPFLGISSGEGQNNTMRAFLDFCGRPEYDDTFEVNDDFDTASERFGDVFIPNVLKITAGNDDYFKWTSDSYAKTHFIIVFDRSKGALKFELYDDQHNVLDTSEDFKLKDPLDSLPNGGNGEGITIDKMDAGTSYYMRVFGVDEAAGQYHLVIIKEGLDDRDHDGVADVDDALPEDASEQFDADGDFIGDNADTDDDNDRLPDVYEIANGFDPLVPNPVNTDTDGDGYIDIDEYLADTDPRDAASFPPPLAIPITVVTNGVVKTDFNGDGRSDIFWRNTLSGQNIIWQMGGATNITFSRDNAIPTLSDLSWEIVGQGDFNGDGTSDILWRNKIDGRNSTWLFKEGKRTKTVKLDTVKSQSWKVAGVGDFDGDGTSDILWRNAVSGANIVWLMQDGVRSSKVDINSVGIATGYEVAAIADMSLDGIDDIIWRSSVNGRNSVWTMAQGKRKSKLDLDTVKSTTYVIAAVEDFNGDGSPDIFWRHEVSGINILWLMQGTTKTSKINQKSVADLNWKIVGTGNYDGNAANDIFWRHQISGSNSLWFFDENGFSSRGRLPNVNNVNFQPQE